MKKYALAMLMLMSLAMAEVSQQEAGIACTPYTLEGETIQISGPLTCEMEYWVCEFMYYGNEQNVMLAISKSDGGVLPADSDIYEDLVSTKYATESGSLIFDTFLIDPTFAIELRGMNSTLLNYQGILESLMDDGHIDQPTYVGLKDRISDIRELAFDVAERTVELYNKSEDFWDAPDCVELVDYLEDLNRTLSLAENFSAAWNEFINRYNSLVSNLDVYVAAINPSNAQIMGESIAAIGSGIKGFYEDGDDFIETFRENLETRFERKETKEILDEAYDIVKVSKNPDATNKYNEASAAFSKGEYLETRRLANEAIALAPIVPPDDDDDDITIIVKEPPDYTIYIIAIGIMIGVILYLTLTKKGGESEKDEEEPGKKQKKGKKKSWGWNKGKRSALGGS